jgi:hypothetical protein
VGIGRGTVLYDGSTREPVEAGSYKVTLNVAAGANYESVMELSLGTFTINSGDGGQGTHITETSPDRVWSSGATLHIELVVSSVVRIYNLGETLVKDEQIAANIPYTTNLPAGFYVITANGLTYKVRIR